MSTAFAVTLANGPIVESVKRKRATVTLQMPSSWSGAAGHAIDFSSSSYGSFTTITDYKFGPSTAVVDFGWVYDLKGTAATGGGITASTCYVCAHSSAGSAATMANSDTDDMSATTTMNLTVWGY